MAKRTWKGVVVKLDNSQGTLTDITASVNNVEITSEQEAVEITPLNADERTYMPGLTGATFSMNGWNDTTTNAIFAPLVGNATSLSKTFQHYDSGKYFKGEVYLTEVTLGVEIGQVQPWNVSGTFTGSISNTTT